MGNLDSPGPVVVGIDGSEAALGAARWAIDEAASRDVAVRLVHGIQIGNSLMNAVNDDYRLEEQQAESVLRTARLAIEAAGTAVKIETALLHGDLVAALVEESLTASLICVGSVGIGWMASHVLGSTAAALAAQAHCPVAIIRTGETTPAEKGWIAVVVDDADDNDAVLQQAFEEARLRDTSMIAVFLWPPAPGEIPYEEIDRRLGVWVRSDPEVHVRPVTARRGIAHYLATLDDDVQMVVMGNGHARHVARIVGPHRHLGLRHPGCSAFVVRQ